MWGVFTPALPITEAIIVDNGIGSDATITLPTSANSSNFIRPHLIRFPCRGKGIERTGN
jgi:hypothetical protein